MRALIAAVVLSWSTAEAGPFCWNEIGFAPADHADLPVSPVIAFAINDQYYGGRVYKRARIPTITATIDGKRVPLSWDDVPLAGGGVLRYLKIRSTATGKLELWRRFDYGDTTPAVQATYTIVKDWSAGTPTLSIEPGKDSLGPYRWEGDYLGLAAAVPAISYTVTWRATTKDAWHALLVPLHMRDGIAEGWLGEEVCGMRENIPMTALAKGVEIEVRALLPNGRIVVVIGPTPLVFEPTNRMPKPARAPGPPPDSG